MFSADSHRLLDVRGPRCQIWDPTVLVRHNANEESSDTSSVSTAPHDYTLDDAKLSRRITALACAEDSDTVFCGRLDGTVCQYDANSGEQVRVLFRHTVGVSIVSLSFDAHSCTLISADSSSQIMVHKLIRERSVWSVANALMDERTGVAVDGLLSNTGCTRLLVCTATKDTLWSIEKDYSKLLTAITWETRRRYRWSTHPANQDHLILITDNAAHLFEWQSLSKLTPHSGIQLVGSVLQELAIRSIMPCFDGRVIAATFAESVASRSKSKLILWNSSDFAAEAKSAIPIPDYQPLADEVECLIGIYGHRLVFLHQDGWICSADSQSFDVEYFDRHFFLPTDWLSTTGGLMVEIFRNGTIVLVQRDELAIIRRGMEHFEQGQSRAIGTRPSLARSTMSDSVLEKKYPMPFR